MKLGVFMKIFSRPRWQDVLDAVAQLEVRWLHFTLQLIAGESLPRTISDTLVDQIARELDWRGLKVASVSGTFNIAHPDNAYRQRQLLGFTTACSVCKALGGELVTLCTGTRNEADMWAYHSDNSTPEALRDMLHTMEQALRIAVRYQINVAFEPERNNVVDSPERAIEVLQRFQHPHLGIIFDPVNILPASPHVNRNDALREAYELLAPYVMLVHAKDVCRTGMAPPGNLPIVDYSLYFGLLREHNFRGALLVHSVTELQLPRVLSFLREKACEQGILAE